MGKSRSMLPRLSTLSILLNVAIAANSNHILKPQPGKTGPQKLMVLLPGAAVDTDYYVATATAIQKASSVNLWVAIPSMGPPKRCIILCPTLGVCSPLHSVVTSIIGKAKDAGYNGSATAPDVFIAGHSLGGICAQRLAIAYPPSEYHAAIVMGSYTEAKSGPGSTAEFPIPILTVGAELDGGLGRPAMIDVRLQGSDSAATNKTQNPTGDASWQLKQKPVVILPHIDHSSFCPGFQVPGDVYPAEATQEEAMRVISTTVSAFLALQTNQPPATQTTALATLSEKLVWTRKLLAPLHEAYAWEAGDNSGNHTYAPLCAKARKC